MEAKGEAAGSRPSPASARCRRRCAPTPLSRPAPRVGRCGRFRKAVLHVQGDHAQSIASRLFLSAAFWSTLILALAGLGLSALNERWTRIEFRRTARRLPQGADGQRRHPNEEAKAARPAAIAPQFELAFSGWYGRSPGSTRIRRRSGPRSHCSRPNCRICPRVGDKATILSGYVIGPGEHASEDDRADYRRRRRGPFPGPGRRERGRDSGPRGGSFEWALAATFLTLALALIGSTALVVRFGLRPLRVLQEGVAAIRRGESERIAGEFPQEVAPLATEVNQLIDANRGIVERARTQVGNLAHALKTPLSVLDQRGRLAQPRVAGKDPANRRKSCAGR